MANDKQLNDHDFNNNVLVFGPASAGISQRALEVTCSLTYNQTLYKEREGPDAIMPWTWYWLWNDGLLKVCAEKANCGISRLAAIFTDGHSFVGPGQDGLQSCDKDKDIYMPGDTLPKTFRTLWTWHNRAGHDPDECVDIKKNSMIGAVRRRIRELLDQGLDMGGRDLFPGPGVFS